MTKLAYEAAHRLDVTLLDHLILAKHTYTSFQEAGPDLWIKWARQVNRPNQ